MLLYCPALTHSAISTDFPTRLLQANFECNNLENLNSYQEYFQSTYTAPPAPAPLRSEEAKIGLSDKLATSTKTDGLYLNVDWINLLKI